MQFIYEGIKRGDKGLYITFEENLNTLKGDALVYGWDFGALEKERKCIFLSFKPLENPDLLAKISKHIETHNIKRVVIDSISVFSMIFRENYYRIYWVGCYGQKHGRSYFKGWI